MFQDTHYGDLFVFESFSRIILLESTKVYRSIYKDPIGATLERLTSENSVRVSRRRRPIREQSVALCEIEPRDAVYLGIYPVAPLSCERCSTV